MARRHRLLCAALLLAACAAPHRDYDLAKIRQTDDLVELMDVQATVADPLFGELASWQQNGVPAASWPRLLDAGTRLQATAAQVARLQQPKGFLAHNQSLMQQARALATASSAQDGPGALRALAQIRQSCRACHREFR